MFYNCVIIILLCATRQTMNDVLKVVHYENITQTSCGFKLSSTKTAIAKHSCFKWHKTILEEKTALKTIMYGRYVDDGEFPYTALIQMSGWFSGAICTGAVLNSMWIITVAHCFKGWSASELKIYPGITDYRETSNEYYEAEKIIRYEKYVADKVPEKMYDLALIKLTTNIEFNRNTKVNSVYLPNRDYSNLTSLSTLTGWGYLNEHEPNERRLKMTAIVLDKPYVSEPFFIISSDIKYGRGCPGDSGGPLVQYVNNRAVLIGSHIGADVDHCGQHMNFMKFAYIPFYIDWIKNKILTN